MVPTKRDKGIPIHPPREGRDETGRQPEVVLFEFQSTLHVWGGTCILSGAIRSLGFQSTLPARGGTYSREWATRLCLISIHPPRVGRDRDKNGIFRCVCDFNPPSPCGEGPPFTTCSRRPGIDFNPPSPCGEGPLLVDRLVEHAVISIRPPCEGRDGVFHQR